MPTLSIPNDDLAQLIVRMRGLQAQEGEVDPDEGSNAIDDNAIDALQDSPDDLTRRQIMSIIRDYDDRQQAELVALLWTGRGDAEPEEWEQTVALAIERKTLPTAVYLMRQPLGAEHMAEGLERLGVDVPLSDPDEPR